jgi:16S rRNA processing protein RimM
LGLTQRVKPAGPGASANRPGVARASGTPPDWSGAFVAVARIVRPRGRHGEVQAEILTDFPARLALRRWAFLEGSRTPSPVAVENVWMHQGRVVFKFEGVDSIGQAEPLRGQHVLIPREERAPLGPHQYYFSELRGCSVLRKGVDGPLFVGVVEDVERTAGGEILHVSTRAGEVLIPLAQEICRRVDLAARVIVIDPPEDLLELNSPRGA